jgi:hypothetical protein
MHTLLDAFLVVGSSILCDCLTILIETNSESRKVPSAFTQRNWACIKATHLRAKICWMTLNQVLDLFSKPNGAEQYRLNENSEQELAQ